MDLEKVSVNVVAITGWKCWLCWRSWRGTSDGTRCNVVIFNKERQKGDRQIMHWYRGTIVLCSVYGFFCESDKKKSFYWSCDITYSWGCWNIACIGVTRTAYRLFSDTVSDKKRGTGQ